MTRLPNKYGPKTTLDVQQSYVGGACLQSTSNETFATRYPGTDAIICDVEVAGQEEIDKAVVAASDAFESWSQTPAAERGEILLRAASI